MENVKLKFNKLGKKILLPVAMAFGLQCASLSAESLKTYKDYKETPHIESISLGSQELVYENVAQEYTEEKAIATLKNIIDSDLNKMKSYSRLETKVQKEVVGHLADMNARSLELARFYKALEDHNIAKTDSKAINKIIANIIANDGVNASVEELIPVSRIALQHLMHMFLDSQTLIRFGADEAELRVINEGKEGKMPNQYIKFSTNGKRDMRQEINAVSMAAKDYIALGKDGKPSFTEFEYQYNGKGQNGKDIAKKIDVNLQEIEILLYQNQKGLTQEQYQGLLKLIIETADLLPEEMYGTRAARRGLVIEFALDYAMNHLLTVVTNLGYDIDNLKADAFIKEDNFKFETKVNAAFTDKHATFGLGLGSTGLLNQNWDLTLDGELNFNRGYGNFSDSTQILASGEIGRTINDNHRLGLGIKGGIQFDDNDKTSAPFGADIIYTWKPDKNLAFDFGVGSLINIQNALADIGVEIGATYRRKSLVIRFAFGFGYTLAWDHNHTISTPNNPTIDTDTTPPNKTKPDKTKKGGMNDSPEKPLDIDLY